MRQKIPEKKVHFFHISRVFLFNFNSSIISSKLSEQISKKKFFKNKEIDIKISKKSLEIT